MAAKVFAYTIYVAAFSVFYAAAVAFSAFSVDALSAAAAFSAAFLALCDHRTAVT